jgi:hypothetical protein
MALTKQAIAAIAARRSANKTAANDDAPKAPRARLALPNFVDTVFASEISLGTTTEGKPYMTLKGCNVTLASGTPAIRTVMAFDDSYEAVRAAIAEQRDVVATLAHTGSTLKIIGLQIDGEMRMFEQRAKLDKAA